jgi:UDP-glucose 4-epimerase
MAVRAVVTGGAGFIGSHVVDALLARGDEVHVVDTLETGRRENVPAAATLHERDIREPAGGLYDEIAPEAVFHLAAQADVGTSVERPDFDATVNVVGTIRVLEEARRHGARVVLASTGGAIYGECDGPASEDAPRRPLSPYGTAKLAAEEYLATWNRLYGSSHVALRFANVYGPRQLAKLEGGVVAIFMDRLRAGEGVTIFGDGEQTRDFVYVGDVVRALLAAADGDVSGEFNVGTGIETSVLDLIEELAIVGGRRDFNPEQLPPRPGEVERMILDSTLARERLRWEPQTGLREGLTETWRENVRRRHGPHRQIYEVPGAGPQAASG